MRRFTSRKMAENRGLLAHPTPPVGVTIQRQSSIGRRRDCGPMRIRSIRSEAARVDGTTCPMPSRRKTPSRSSGQTEGAGAAQPPRPHHRTVLIRVAEDQKAIRAVEPTERASASGAGRPDPSRCRCAPARRAVVCTPPALGHPLGRHRPAYYPMFVGVCRREFRSGERRGCFVSRHWKTSQNLTLRPGHATWVSACRSSRG